VVVTGSGSAGDSGGGPVVDQGTGLAPGALPPDAGAGNHKPVDPVKPETDTKVDTKPEVKPEIKPEVKPEVKPKPEPKFVECEAVSQPQPTIPDDLRTEELSKDFVAELEVGTDGIPKSVKTTQSTGINELDQLALDAARKWRFTPATLDGVPTEQTVRIKIEFRVQ